MQKLLRVALALAVLLAYAAPVEAMFSAAAAGCCKGHACCRRAHGAGWMAGRSSCGGACCCAFAPVPAPADAPRAGSAAIALVSRAAAVWIPQARPVSRAPIFLYQRPPPTC
ncbi:MAG TPA: hypothetical protein VKX45_02935 [Bryobacteraceae bacterium]|nr:hypothetical protein [Bryobacteraceae bacterium]